MCQRAGGGLRLKPEEARRLFCNDEAVYLRVCALQNIDFLTLRRRVRRLGRDEAVAAAIRVVEEVLEGLTRWGFEMKAVDPAHGVGHMARDYVTALRLSRLLPMNESDKFIGVIGGMLHDIGCFLYSRHAEGTRLARHAEAGALLIANLFASGKVRVNAAEAELIEYAVAAHTKYLAPMTFTGPDGVARTIEPYQDEDNGTPRLAVWFARWVDRLDCMGPTGVGRGYLSYVAGADWMKPDFGQAEYERWMRPTAVGKAKEVADARTYAEFLKVFVDTQNARSPYCHYDLPGYIRLRDRQSARTRAVVDAVTASRTDSGSGARISPAWKNFLAENIEPTPFGRRVAEALAAQFEQLPGTTRAAWSRGFSANLQEYTSWERETLSDLEAMPADWMRLARVTDDVRKIVRLSPNARA